MRRTGPTARIMPHAAASTTAASEGLIDAQIIPALTSH